MLKGLINILLCSWMFFGLTTQGQHKLRPASSPYLFIWAGDADRKDTDFLAVIDVRPKSKRYGHIVATLPVGVSNNYPHHTLNRIVTSSADMDEKDISHVVQIWRCSDFKLLKSIYLQGPVGIDPAEPRLLSDGRTVLVSTFTCGLYRITNLESENPSTESIHAFGGKNCALPVVAGNFWIQTVPESRALVSLDISNSANPIEVSRLVLGENDKPHWIALEPNGERIVISGGGSALESRILLVKINKKNGTLSLDESFREKGSKQPGVSFDREQWLHGKNGKAIPHGAVFSLP
jgi:hypothetical protein